MSTLRQIFSTFSRRPRSPEGTLPEVPQTFRIRLLQWLIETLSRETYRDLASEFFPELQRLLRMRYGRVRLSERRASSEMEDLEAFWRDCPSDHFLDIIEDICRLSELQHIPIRGNDIVEAINSLMAVDDMPYQLTKFVFEYQTGNQTLPDLPIPLPKGGVTVSTTAYPQIILREDEVMHQESIDPALDLLSNPAFKNPNQEYREALRHYRKGEYGDALTKCGSAFESVMKIICDRKGWVYDPKATAAPLVKTMIQQTTLDPFLEQVLLSVATIRNRFSTSHGAGVVPRMPTRQLTRYALNSTASAMLLLAEEAGLI